MMDKCRSGINSHIFYDRPSVEISYQILNSSSDYRGNAAPSDSEFSRRDSDTPTATVPSSAGGGGPPRLGIPAPSADSESGGSHSPSPRALRKRSKGKTHSLTSLCLLSHHPFFTTFRECLFVLKKLIDACNESTSPKRSGGSRPQVR